MRGKKKNPGAHPARITPLLLLLVLYRNLSSTGEREESSSVYSWTLPANSL
jgi:hypothetical protein